MQAKWIVMSVLLAGGAGCAAPMDQLIEEANQTGDWSRVEKRELAQERREQRMARRINTCGAGALPVSVRGASAQCTEQRDVVRAFQRARTPVY